MKLKWGKLLGIGRFQGWVREIYKTNNNICIMRCIMRALSFYAIILTIYDRESNTNLSNRAYHKCQFRNEII